MRIVAVPILALAVLVDLACSESAIPDSAPSLAPPAPRALEQGLFNNGGFESGTTNWTITAFQNPGLAVVPPTSVANLALESAQTTLGGALGTGGIPGNSITVASTATFDALA